MKKKKNKKNKKILREINADFYLKKYSHISEDPNVRYSGDNNSSPLDVYAKETIYLINANYFKEYASLFLWDNMKVRLNRFSLMTKTQYDSFLEEGSFNSDMNLGPFFVCLTSCKNFCTSLVREEDINFIVSDIGFVFHGVKDLKPNVTDSTYTDGCRFVILKKLGFNSYGYIIRDLIASPHVFIFASKLFSYYVGTYFSEYRYLTEEEEVALSEYFKKLLKEDKADETLYREDWSDLGLRYRPRRWVDSTLFIRLKEKKI